MHEVTLPASFPVLTRIHLSLKSSLIRSAARSIYNPRPTTLNHRDYSLSKIGIIRSGTKTTALQQRWGYIMIFVITIMLLLSTKQPRSSQSEELSVDQFLTDSTRGYLWGHVQFGKCFYVCYIQETLSINPKKHFGLWHSFIQQHKQMRYNQYKARHVTTAFNSRRTDLYQVTQLTTDKTFIQIVSVGGLYSPIVVCMYLCIFQ